MSSIEASAILHLVRAQALIEGRLSGELGSVHGLSLTDAILLMHLEKAAMGRLTRVELGKRLHVNPSTVTRATAPLEKIGLVAREADARDARIAYVALTKIGRTVVSQVRATLDAAAADFFRAAWSPPDIAALDGLLARLTAGEAGDLT